LILWTFCRVLFATHVSISVVFLTSTVVQVESLLNSNVPDELKQLLAAGSNDTPRFPLRGVFVLDR